jgi:hypothetical protein
VQRPDKRGRPEKFRPADLSSDASKTIPAELISGLELINDPEALATWAHRVLPLKNKLSTADARAVEAAFATRLTELDEATPQSLPESHKANGGDLGRERAELASEEVSVICKPVRERDRDHLRFVAAQPCLVCGRTPSDSHHIKFAEQRTMGRKVSDRFTVPICRLHHRELHRLGNERAWWQNHGIDPLLVATSLWAKTHAITPTTDLAADTDRPANVNGSDSGAVVLHQNDETKPILRPEAK